jgi:23S rRNA (cytosine1962-C5)-methyltransferase
MEELAARRETFDVVVIDPPSFTRTAAHRARALAAYARLTTLGLPLLRPGGLLVQASCSSRVAAADFHDAVHRAARTAGRPLLELERTGHPPDHPITFHEGEYLTCLWARVPG